LNNVEFAIAILQCLVAFSSSALASRRLGQQPKKVEGRGPRTRRTRTETPQSLRRSEMGSFS